MGIQKSVRGINKLLSVSLQPIYPVSISMIFQFTPFGIGKRICLGESLAKDSIFIFFAMMLQNLKFEVDPSKPRPNPKDTIMVITNMLKPFHVSLSQRK